MNTKHTPGPIEVTADGFNGIQWQFLVIFPDSHGKKAQAVDDCRHLERCWNTHDELLAALEGLLAWTERQRDSVAYESVRPELKKARAALDKARSA